MKNFNWIFGVVLAIVSILTIMANYFNVVTLFVTIVDAMLSVSFGFIAMLQVYHYQSLQNHNPGKFWLIYSTCGGVVLIGVCYASIFNLVSKRFAVSTMIGLTSILIPIFGVLIGDIARVLTKSESSAI